MLAAVATTLALVAPASTPGWVPDVAQAAAFARTRRGAVHVGVRTACGAWGREQDLPAPSASVLKAMLLVAYLERPGVRDRPLDARQRRLLAPMIQVSANTPATRVLEIVGADRLAAAARRWGMRAFALRRPWGLSQITARDQARFWLGIERHLPARHRAYAMTLLRTVVVTQRWGIATVAPAGWRLYFKGGWGSGSGAVDHQVALLARGDERVSVAILTSDQGSHAYGRRTLRGVAWRLLRGLAASGPVCRTTGGGGGPDRLP